MINLITKIISLIERLLDWRRETKRARYRNEARRVVAEHDREAMNELLMERMDRK